MMKKSMLNYVLLLFVAFVLVLGGCSSNGAEETTKPEEDSTPKPAGEEQATKDEPEAVSIRVAWWGNQERHDMTQEAIKLFEEKYPHIKVEPEYTGWAGYWERLNTQAAGQNLPDVIAMDNAYLNEYNNNNLLLDLAPFISSGTINLDDVDDVYQEINQDGDKVLAVSLGANALAMLYNKDLIDEAGIVLEPGYTYEDLYDFNMEIKKFKEEQGQEYLGYDFSNAEYELFFAYARQKGESLYNKEGTGFNFEKQTLVDYFAWVQKMVKDGAAPSHDIMMSYIEGGNSMVAEGTSAMQTVASNQIIGIAQGTEYNLGLTILPSLKDGKFGNWIRPSMSFAIPVHAKQEEAAALFIDFFTNSLEANEILQAERGVPISSKVREHLAPLVSDTVGETFNFLELVAEYSSEADPLSPPGETEIRGSFLRVVEALKYDRVTPEEAAKTFMESGEILK